MVKLLSDKLLNHSADSTVLIGLISQAQRCMWAIGIEKKSGRVRMRVRIRRGDGEICIGFDETNTPSVNLFAMW